jgi:hypothetical protein
MDRFDRVVQRTGRPVLLAGMCFLGVALYWNVYPLTPLCMWAIMVGSGTLSLEKWRVQHGLWMLAAIFAAFHVAMFGFFLEATLPFDARSTFAARCLAYAGLGCWAIGFFYFATIAWLNLRHAPRQPSA